MIIVTADDGEIGRLGGGSFMLGFDWGGQGVGIIFLIIFALVLCCLLVVLSRLLHSNCCVCFFVHFLLSLTLVCLIRCY